MMNMLYRTIKETYSRYYSGEVVNFFRNHHSLNNIKNALHNENMILIKYGENMLE